MQRFVLSMVVAFLALLAGLVAWRLADDGSVPMTPSTPARPTVAPTVAPTDDVEPIQGGVSPRADGAPIVVRDDRVARLEVLVLAALGATPPRAVPWRDVDLVAARGETGARLRQRTGADGVARFEVAGAHGRTAEVIAAQNARATVELSADRTGRVVLTITGSLPVQGRVVDQAGTAVPDADIVLVPWIQTDPEAPATRRIGRSGSDGAFAVTLGAGGHLGAERPGYGPSALHTIPPPADPTEPPAVRVLQLTLLNQRATLQVRVRDATGQPVAGAVLDVRPVDAAGRAVPQVAAAQRAITDDDGRTEFDALRPGHLRWAVRARGHATARGRLHAPAGETTALDVDLPASCEVHGYVETADGGRVDGARVWSGAAEDFDSVSTISDRDGSFRLVGLRPGHHVLTAREGADSMPPASTRRARGEVDVVAGQVGHWVAVLADSDDSTGLRGTVLDTGERALAGWRVVARAGAAAASATTDARGAFRVARPAPGLVDLFVYAPEAPVGAFAAAVRRGIAPDAEPVEVIVDRAAPTTSMVARVQSPERAPLAATFVCYHRERGEAARFRALDDGSLRVASVPPGTLDVYVEHPGRAPENRRGLVASAAAPIDLGLIVLGDAAALHGSVTGPGGTMPEQVEIALQVPGQRLVAEYAAGVYRFGAAPPGRHVLQVQGPGVAGASFEVELTAGVDREQPIELRAGVPRRIVVRVPRPVGPTASLAVRVPGQPHTWYGVAAAQPAASGSSHGTAEFVVFMAPGTYDAIAWCTDAWQGRAQVAFVDGDDSPITIELHPD